MTEEPQIIPKNVTVSKDDLFSFLLFIYQSNDSNNGIEGSYEGENLKPGQYLLSTLEAIMINMKMPKGFKLETEENVIKAIEAPKTASNRHKVKYSLF